MPESNPRSRFVRPILTGWFCIGVFGALWWQFGAWAILPGLALIVLATAIWGIRKVAPRWQSGEGSVDMSNLHERIISPVPFEAAIGRERLYSELFGGILLLAFISSTLTELTGAPFLIVFAAVTSGVVFTGAMILAWAISRANTRRKQFSIATLLILLTLSAVYLGVIRLLVDLSGEQLGGNEHPFLAVAVTCVVLAGFSLPFLLIFMVRLIWLAAWLVRRPWVQEWIRR